jgi:eukaryotic-like serine/threonine-protein kinase
MTEDHRVEELLEELLDSGGTPDGVCRDCPELLPQVRAGWKQLRALQAEVAALFPESSSGAADTHRSSTRHWPSSELPQIAGYEVQEVIGHGGMGIVYKARHLKLNRAVALKMLLAGVYAQPVELERLFREAEAVAALRHPNIVQVYEVGDVDGRPYFTMEFVEGGSLAEKMTGTPQPPREAAELVADLAEAVQVAHQQGIIHRDLKPANVLLTADGMPKLTDFGLARWLQNDSGLTLSGTPVGTPSYMAPEQAQGEKRAIGPAADIYALGAILYEMLTGRPPFRAETSASTLQQALREEPVPPSHLNRRVLRDLETICLKCLHKDPNRRYASAAALAEDLRRFERGDAIRARPTPLWERVARWTRRHPVTGTLVSIGLLGAACAGVGLLWINHEQAVNAVAIENDLREVAQFGEVSEFDKARSALARTEARLANGAPAEVRRRVQRLPADLELAARLEGIRLERSTYVEGRRNHPAELRYNNMRADRDYEKAFDEAGVCKPPNEPKIAVDQLRAAPMRAPLAAALDDWAVCCPDKHRQEWLLSVARLLDPDPWRDRVRDMAAWEDPAALAALARAAPVEQRVQLPMLLTLAARLQVVDGNATALLQRVQARYPHDFWANFTLANTLYGEGTEGRGDPAQAIVFYRQAINLRPRTAAAYNNLGLALLAKYWLDDKPDQWGVGALETFREALRIDPAFGPAFTNLGYALKNNGDWNAAAYQYERALRIDPELAPAHANLAELLAGSGKFYDAIDHYQKAIKLDPDFALAHFGLGLALESKHYLDEANENYPEGLKPLDLVRGAALRESLTHYQQALHCDPKWTPATNIVQIPSRDESLLSEAIDHFRQAIRLEPSLAVAHGALGQALLAKWNMHEAEAFIIRGLDLLPPTDKELRPNLESELRRCRHLTALESRLPAIVQGKEKPASSECLEVAELCFVNRRYAAAARFYAEAFSAVPALADDLRTGSRFNAACAAALAGCGSSDDAGRLDESELRALREQARKFLQLDLAAWRKKVADGTPADPIQAQRVLAIWRRNPHLACLRDSNALEKLSPAERRQWQVLWQTVEEAQRAAANEPLNEASISRLRTQIVGKWRHNVAGNVLEITLLRDGKINDESGRATWALQGRVLRLSWPDDNAPNRMWVDICRVSEDGNSYAGTNQGGAEIRGTKIIDVP